jgi:hypothetical protein
MSIPHLAAPQAIPRQSAPARWFAHAGWMECQRIAAVYGFSLTWEDDGDERTLMLLGADSPADMTLTITRAHLDASRLEVTTRMILLWMLERGRYWTDRDIDWLALRDAVLGDERD